MSVERVIQAQYVDAERVESFPYFTAQYSTPLDEEEEAPEAEPEDDSPVSALYSSPEEDSRRLASVDQIIFEKLQQAERDAQDQARKGYEEGFQAGEIEGRQFGESQYKAHMQRLDAHLQEVSASLDLNTKAAKDEILALALAMAEHLAGREIEDGSRTLAPLLDHLLETRPFPAGAAEGPEAQAFTALLNPKDLELLSASERAYPGLLLREDPELSRGSLRLVAAAGVLDATLERRRDNLLKLIHKHRQGELP